MNPLWVEFPDIPWGSLGWRMGFGEQYWAQWQPFYLSLSAHDREIYRRDWPESDEWKGLYEFIETGNLPVWAVAHRQKLSGPFPLPVAAEQAIEDPYRVIWLIRNHLLRLGTYEVPAQFPSPYLGPTSEESAVEFYAEPDGAWWRVAFLAKAGVRMQRLTHSSEPSRLLI